VSHKVVSSTLHHAWFGSHTVIVWNLSLHMSIGVYKVGSSTPYLGTGVLSHIRLNLVRFSMDRSVHIRLYHQMHLVMGGLIHKRLHYVHSAIGELAHLRLDRVLVLFGLVHLWFYQIHLNMGGLYN